MKTADKIKVSIWNWKVVGFGFALLLVGSFLDNLRGPLLPQITTMLALDYSQSSSLIFIGNISSVFAALLLAYATERFRPVTIAKFSLSIAILACGMSLLVSNAVSLALFASMLGAAIVIMGSISNLFVISGTPAHMRSRVLAGLHSLYGFGSVAAALSIAAQTHYHQDWRMIFIGTGFALLLMLLALIQHRSKAIAPSAAVSNPKSPIAWRELLICLPLTIYVLGEVGCSMWMVTFVSSARNVSPSESSVLLSAFFGIMATTRLIVFLAVRTGHEWQWMRLSMVAAVSFFALGIIVHPYFLPMTGVLGPFFPLYVSYIRFSQPLKWQSLTLISFAMMQGCMAVMHYGMGWTVDRFGAETAYLVPLVFLCVACCTTFTPRQREPTLPRG